MNVIFLDFDGVIDTVHYQSDEEIDYKLKIVADIAKEHNCKIVIEAAAKCAWNLETGEIEGKWLKFVLDTLNKYGVEVIGRTPSIRKYTSKNSYYEMWKEYEIISYLRHHPEIEHFCIIDDNNFKDLEKVKDYLVQTKDYFPEKPELEGIQYFHSESVGLILKKENRFKKI